MTDQLQGSDQQLTRSQKYGRQPDAEMNDGQNRNDAVNSSNLSSSHIPTINRSFTVETRSRFREYIDNECFDTLVTTVQNAPVDFSFERDPCKEVKEKELITIFERIRRHAVHKKLTNVNEAILFAVADIFASESKDASWYGPKLVSRMMLVGSNRTRFLILQLMWSGFRAKMKLNMTKESTIQLLKGLLIVFQEVSQFVDLLGSMKEQCRNNLDSSDHAASQNLKPKWISLRKQWLQLQKNLSTALWIIRLFVRVDQIRDFINKYDAFLSVAGSLITNPILPEGAFRTCLSFAGRWKGFLGALDKREPLGNVPQVVMHVAEYCMYRRRPSWSVPRFLTKENVTVDKIKQTSVIAFAAVKSLAASIDRKSLFFEPLCDSVMRMYGTEVLDDTGTIMGQAFGTLLSRFPSRVPLRDEFMVQLISGIHSCKDEIADLVETLLDVIIAQYPSFVQKHLEAIGEARSVRKLLQDSLDGKLDFFPEILEDWRS